MKAKRPASSGAALPPTFGQRVYRCCQRFLGKLVLGMLATGALHLGAGAEQVASASRGKIDTVELARRLYPSDDAPLLWTSQRQMDEALSLLQTAASHGLQPRHYGVERLARRIEQQPVNDRALDHDLSLAMLQFLSDLQFGRVPPDVLLPAPQERLQQYDPVEQLRAALAHDALAAAVEAAAPPIPLYRRMRAALQHYRGLAERERPWRAPAGLRPDVPLAALGQPVLSALHERLLLLGDVDPDAPSATAPEALAAALRRFQARHHLAENGRLDRDTASALTVPLSHRVKQLELTLERLRWMPPLRPGRFIVVNVAAYRLWAFDNSAIAPAEPLEMKVIVGKAARTPTPLFIGQMRYLEFNPYWNVPPSIARAEIAPKLSRNPDYLAEQGMELVTPTGQVQRSATADSAAALRAGSLRVRQRPGSHNVLGAVKFAMPNPMNIYLHSTSAKELFGRTRRDLSHGCIRVERPAELAQFVLAGQAPWDARAIEAAMAPGPTRTVKLAEAIPVVLFYATAVSDRHGRTLFAQDIYRRDDRLMRALDQH